MDYLNLFAVFVVSIATFVYVFFEHRFGYWQRKGIPFVKPTFPYGSLGNVGKTAHVSELTWPVYNKWKDRAKAVGLYFIYRPALLVLDQELIKTILIKDFNNFDERGSFYNEKHDPLSAHLFAVEGKKWRSLRIKLTPTFTSGKMKFMLPTVVDVGKSFRAYLNETIVGDENVIEIRDILSRYTSDVIGTCAFGIKCNSFNEPDAEFRNMGRAAFENPRFGMVALSIIHLFAPLAKWMGVRTTRDDVAKFFMKVVNETIDFREKNNVQRNDFMDMLIKMKNEGESRLTVNEIAAQVFLFFLGGFETSATTMAYALYEMALNKKIQAKARQELRTVLNKHNGQFTYEAMMEMTYIDQVISETLRKYPALTHIVRKAQNNYKVPNMDLVIDKGTRIYIPVRAIHLDPEYYPDPERFDPDRFTPEAVAARAGTQWLAFGEGPRKCIGSRFGMMQTRIGLTSILGGFDLSVCDETSVPLQFVVPNFLLTPVGGIRLNFRKLSD